MKLVLTMAGRYQRFVDAGYPLPKYLLPWGDHSILSTILSCMPKEGSLSDIFLIGNERDAAFMPHVRVIMESHNISRQNLILIEDTSGQAETAFLGLNACYIKDDESVLFHNIDTILYFRDFEFIAETLKGCHGFIDVFEANNKEYSFVIEKDGKVLEIAEKVVVSNRATSGLYGFSSARLFRDYYTRHASTYISELYREMIEDGLDLRVGTLHKETDTVVLGTPAEYLSAVGRWV